LSLFSVNIIFNLYRRSNAGFGKRTAEDKSHYAPQSNAAV
jgi:hypothetical protein